MSAKGDVLERKTVIDVTASLKNGLGGETVRRDILIFGGYGVTKFTFPTMFPYGEIQRYPLV
jgi:hypothetical protein